MGVCSRGKFKIQTNMALSPKQCPFYFPWHPRLHWAPSKSLLIEQIHFARCLKWSWTNVCLILSDFALAVCSTFLYVYYKLIFTIAVWSRDSCPYCRWEYWTLRDLNDFPKLLHLESTMTPTQVCVMPMHGSPIIQDAPSIFHPEWLLSALQPSSHHAGPRPLSSPKCRAWNWGRRCVSTHRLGQRFLRQTPRHPHGYRLTFTVHLLCAPGIGHAMSMH